MKVEKIITGETIRTPRGTFYVSTLTKQELKEMGFGYHHSSDDGKFEIFGDGTFAVAIHAERRS